MGIIHPKEVHGRIRHKIGLKHGLRNLVLRRSAEGWSKCEIRKRAPLPGREPVSCTYSAKNFMSLLFR